VLLLPLLACAHDWHRGDLVIEQVAVDGEAEGEARLVVGPDGTSVLVDVANDRHALELAEATEDLLGERAVDTVLLTDWSAGHVGGGDDILGDHDEHIAYDTLLTRGPWDVRGGEYADVCAIWDERRVDLCTAEVEPACDAVEPATACPGLPTTIALGDGAELVVVAADGFTAEGAVTAVEGEPARSVVFYVHWGDFWYLDGGDIPAEVESALATGLAEVPAVNVLHVDDHGRADATNSDWIDRFLPDDGADRAAIIGSNGGYADAPAASVLEALAPRVRGIWMPAAGENGSSDGATEVHDHVVVRVRDDATYTVQGESFP
jgi:hypothetical protein